ncbi:hypothetical protein OG304_24615 [Streptomyces sp. NBC_00160]|uniref:hypothetical protein n=1 Tax=Streptomyces sp. NBC_00160 TaxID=2903628 RepID=UPI002259479D|nr:hypothetical protein [Streptomyces sp. NBC_00160]MCX5306605.1 hypothetical protein [Streptomyces sp. NBC_00160]
MTHSNLREPSTGNTASGSPVQAGPGRAIPATDASGGKALLNPEMAARPFDFRGHGVFEREVTLPGSRGAGTMVLASITEFSPVTDDPIMGSAIVTLHSVAPQSGGTVKVRMEVRWPEDLSVRVQFMYFL